MPTSSSQKGPHLEVLNGNVLTGVFALVDFNDNDEITIGCSSSCNLRLDDDKLSRIQLKLLRKNYHFSISHYSPKVATFLDGQLLDEPVNSQKPITLAHNTEFSFDDSNIKLRFVDHDDTLVKRKDNKGARTIRTTIQFEPYPEQGYLFYEGQRVQLSRQLMSICVELRDAVPNPCKTARLQKVLFNGARGEVYPLIRRLRDELSDDNKTLIQNVRGIGYKLNLGNDNNGKTPRKNQD